MGILLNSLQMTLEEAGESSTHLCKTEDLNQLQYQTQRINNQLVQLLAIYRIDQEQYDPFIETHLVSDFLDDCLTLNSPLLRGQHIEFSCHCDESLEWSFDEGLLTGIVNNTIVNIVHYSHKRLDISASIDNGHLRIDFADDGSGYPERLLNFCGKDQKINFSNGGTGLGLHFIKTAVELHQQDGKQGTMKISNHGVNGGGLLTIMIPNIDPSR